MDPVLACGHDPLAIATFADGEAATPDRAMVEEWLLSCRDCRSYWDSLRELDHWFVLARLDAPPAGFSRRVMAGVARRERGRIPIQFGIAAVAAALIVIGVAMTMAPAEGLAGSVVASDPGWSDLATGLGEPLALAFEMDVVAVSGLCVAVAASVFLLSRLIQYKGV